MWLLDADTKQLGRVSEATGTPEYAIFTHCWKEEDVDFHDIQNLDSAQQKAGLTVVENACSTALAAGVWKLWIDRLCIDRTSSGELSEALNSMFQWFQNAQSLFCLPRRSGSKAGARGRGPI